MGAQPFWEYDVLQLYVGEKGCKFGACKPWWSDVSGVACAGRVSNMRSCFLYVLPMCLLVSEKLYCFFFLAKHACMQVQTSRKLWHPVNWSGYVLFGRDTVLHNQLPKLADTLRQVMKSGGKDNGRSAFNVLRSLVGAEFCFLFDTRNAV